MRDPISIEGEPCLRKSPKVVLCVSNAMHTCAHICVTHTHARKEGKEADPKDKNSKTFFSALHCKYNADVNLFLTVVR